MPLLLNQLSHMNWWSKWSSSVFPTGEVRTWMCICRQKHRRLVRETASSFNFAKSQEENCKCGRVQTGPQRRSANGILWSTHIQACKEYRTRQVQEGWGWLFNLTFVNGKMQAFFSREERKAQHMWKPFQSWLNSEKNENSHSGGIGRIKTYSWFKVFKRKISADFIKMKS